MSRFTLVGPLYPYRGGIAHFLETMYRGLGARGHNLEAITYTRQYPELLFPGKTQLAEERPADSVPAERLIDTLNPWSWIKTGLHVRRRRPDALVYKYWMPFFAPAYGTVTRMARHRGVRSIVVVDNALPHERRPGDKLLGRYFLNACDGFIVMSESVEDDLRALGASAPIRRVQHPTYDRFGDAPSKQQARSALDLPPDAPVLLFFGFEAPYRRRIVEHGLTDSVHLHAGYVADDTVPRYFAAADAVVQPYVSATQSGVAQIAFHFEKPVITTDVGGLAEIVPHEEAGLVVPPERPARLAGAVTRFFDEALAPTLAEGVRAQKQKHSWDPLYEAVEELASAR
ncbi:MAG: glycosyl transferase [Bacteroidetes bacterium QS_8_64_10]|nr:MAG: glycosyl transferase [Bacteroidetes bacterium QS_8_64_10]